LVELGVVKRTDIPPSALFELPSRSFAAQLVRELSDARHALLKEMQRTASRLKPAPASIVLFGSMASGNARADSDIDVLIVRPKDAVDENAWTASLTRWASRLREFSGNPVNLVEEHEEDIPRLLRSRRALWEDIHREGILLAGKPLGKLGRRSA
jgi:predicted nucleotidyltransferase